MPSWSRAGAGEGSFDRQEEFVLQEVAYSGDEAAVNSTGGGGIVGGYQPRKVGNLHERFASALGLAVEVIEKGRFCVFVRRWVSVQVFMHCFLASA